MSEAALAIVLTAALLHASWNAVLKKGTDRFRTMAVMKIATMVIAIPAIFFVPTPAAAAAWPALALSAAIHFAYDLSLLRAYAHGDFSQVYPIARGSSPLLVTLGAAAVVGEWPDPGAFAGIILVSFGILMLAKGWSQGASSAGIAAAITTGVLIAAYTVVDGVGGRASGDAMSYAAWLFLLEGPPIPIIYWLARPESARLIRLDPVTLRELGGGFVSVIAYGGVIYAATIAPMSEVSALRETSVVFAALLGRMFLAERLPAARVASCLAVAAGAIILGRFS